MPLRNAEDRAELSLAPGTSSLVALILALPFGLTTPVRAAEQAYCVAMHVHASFSEGDGSFEWHTQKGREVGMDAIWWSEHDWRATHWQYTKEHTFESSVYEGFFARWAEPDEAYPGHSRFWALSGPQISYSSAIVDSLAIEGSKSFMISATDAFNSTTFRSVKWLQAGTNKQSQYPLASRFHLRFAVFPEVLQPDSSRFVLEATLSLHPEGYHALRYVLGSMDGEGPASTSLPYTLGTWNVYTLDLTGDAIAKLTKGGADSLRAEDNSLFMLRASLEARWGSQVKVFLDDFRFLPDSTQTESDVLAKQEQFVQYYEAQTPELRQIVGSEFSRYFVQPHLNVFTPTPMMIDYGSYTSSDPIDYAVEQVHAAGGAISYNHMFGTGIYGNLSETAEQKAARVLAMKQHLIPRRIHGVDLLEVGYRWREGIVLEDHLDTWDTMTANGIFVTGNGVSDTHGTFPFNGWGPWQPSATFENNFATWFWASELSETALIQSMVSGRAFFGDPYAFQGTVDLATGEGFPMGRVLVTDRDSHGVLVSVEGVGDSAEVRLLQGEIETSGDMVTTVNWIRDELLDGTIESGTFSDSVTVETELSSFVRIEAKSGTGGPGSLWAYSNPIHFLREIPSAGLRVPRVGGTLGPIVIRSASAFVLKSASFDSATVSLTLGGDEAPFGTGSFAIDCGILGEPSTVTGATQTAFDAGVLTISGFSGEGSIIEVLWGGGTPDGGETIHEVSLANGRPNPFSDGEVVCEFALPAPTRARLDVLDVRGRLVRTLLDAERNAGIQRVPWNGTDSAGRPVANGIYFLRLEAGGRTLSSKVVKVR